MGEQPKATDLALVQHFSHMHHHRCVVLEGVREAAFRNVDHLTRTMRELGTERITTQTSLAKVQDRMLRDQGLQPSASQRWWLGSGALNMWEIYLCLLSAELEAYLSMRSSFPSAELDEFIQVNAPVLGRLRALRDKFLHPAKDEAYDGLLRGFVEATEQNYPSHLPFGKHLQILLDEHLEHLKEHLADSIANEVAHLPANALHALLTRKTAMLDKALRAAERATDREAIQRLMDDQKRLIDEHKRLGEHLGFDPPGKEPLHMATEKACASPVPTDGSDVEHAVAEHRLPVGVEWHANADTRQSVLVDPHSQGLPVFGLLPGNAAVFIRPVHPA